MFPRSTYQSTGTGLEKRYVCTDEVRALAGSADRMRVQLIGFSIDPSTEVRLYMYESPYLDMRPDEIIDGGTPFFTSATVVSLRPVPEAINATFADNVVFVLGIKHTGTSALVVWDGLVAATLIHDH